MSVLELRYDAAQPHQLEAVCALFSGQRFAATSFTLEGGFGPAAPTRCPSRQRETCERRGSIQPSDPLIRHVEGASRT